MKSSYFQLKRFTSTVLRLGLILFLSLCLFTREVRAQDTVPEGVTPQKVSATIDIEQTRTDTGELISSHHGTLEFWNVGAMGDSTYETATLTMEYYYHKEGTATVTFEFNFSGGPDGVFTLISGPNYVGGTAGSHMREIMDDPGQVWIANEMETVQQDCQLSCYVLSGLSNTYWYKTESCEPFAGWFPSCSTCSAAMTWDANLQAGDVLSPAISYTGPDGNPIEILGQALYINGKETWSIVWDGQPAALELQYTCPDNIGHTLNLTVPAAGANQPNNQNPPQSPPQSSAPQPKAEKTITSTSLKDLIKIILVGVGVISIGTGAVALGRKFINTRPQSKPAIERSVKPSSQDSSAKESIKSTQKTKLSQQERAELKNKAAKLDAKWSEIKREINQREKQLLNLKRKNTSNRFKVMIKKAIEVKETVSGPIGKFVGEGFKGATGVDIDKMLFDLDNKKDVDILVAGKQCQATLTNYVNTLKQELLKTGREHSKIQNQLAEPEE